MYKIIFKGKWKKRKEQLPVQNARPLRIHPKKVTVFMYLSFIFLLTITKFLSLNSQKSYSLMITILSCLLGFILLIPIFLLHEVLHALCFPKNVPKEIYVNIDNKDIFGISLITYCEAPLKRNAFINMLLLPNLILSILPMFLWIIGVFDFSPLFSKILGLIFSISLCGSLSDLSTICSIYKQVSNKESSIFLKDTTIYITK